MSIQVNMLLVTCLVVERAANNLVVLLNRLWVKFKDYDTELVSFDKTTLWVNSKRFVGWWFKSKVRRCIGVIIQLNCLIFWFIKRTRSKKHFIIWKSFNVRNKRLRVTCERMTYTSDVLWYWRSYIETL